MAILAAAILTGFSIPARSAAQSVVLQWTAPGDDGNVGRATAYEIRYSETPVSSGDTLSWWNAAAAVPGLPQPQVAGTREFFTVAGLGAPKTYFFVLRAMDEVPNTSAFSNVIARQTTLSDTTLAAPSGFSVAVAPSGVMAAWLAVGADGATGARLYRRAAGETIDSLLYTSIASTTSWLDTTVVAGTHYDYSLISFDGTRQSAPATASIDVPQSVVQASEEAIRAYPNPARDRVTLRFLGGTKEGTPAGVRVTIFDLYGRQIRQLVDGEMPAGPNLVEWNCRSDRGNQIAPGLYNVIFDGPRGRSVTHVAIVP